MRFSPELREGVASGDITVSIRLWQRPKVRVGGRYESDGFQIEIDSLEVLPFSAVTADDVSRSGEIDRELLRRRAAHAGPVDEDTRCRTYVCSLQVTELEPEVLEQDTECENVRDKVFGLTIEHGVQIGVERSRACRLRPFHGPTIPDLPPNITTGRLQGLGPSLVRIDRSCFEPCS